MSENKDGFLTIKAGVNISVSEGAAYESDGCPYRYMILRLMDIRDASSNQEEIDNLTKEINEVTTMKVLSSC